MSKSTAPTPKAASRSGAKQGASTASKPTAKASTAAPRQAVAPAKAKSTAKPSSKAPVKPVSKPSVAAAPKKASIPTSKPVSKPTSGPSQAPKAVAKESAKPAPKSAAGANTQAVRTTQGPAARGKSAPTAPPAAKPTTKSVAANLKDSTSLKTPALTAKSPATPTTALSGRQLPQPAKNARPPVEPPAERSGRPIDPKLVNVWKSKAGRDLSDDEVLAMPDSEYMNDKQLEFFRTKLVALKDDLLSNAGETTEHLREDTSVVPDPADRATIEEEHALELRTRDRERKLLKKITQAIARIEAGDYGFCDETGEPIGLGRLIARPTATLTLEAQQRRELKQKMFGD